MTIFRFFILTSLLSVFAITRPLFAQSEICGIWLTQDKEAKIQIYQQGSKFYGKMVWLKNPLDIKGNPVTDSNNPDNGLKRRALINLIIIKDLVYIENEWSKGKLYDPTDGETYDCKVWMENKNTLKVRGYLGFLFETETWLRTSID